MLDLKKIDKGTNENEVEPFLSTHDERLDKIKHTNTVNITLCEDTIELHYRGTPVRDSFRSVRHPLPLNDNSLKEEKGVYEKVGYQSLIFSNFGFQKRTHYEELKELFFKSKFVFVLSEIWRLALLFTGECDGWIIIGLTALFTACSANWIEIVVQLLSDWKIGFCSSIFALNRTFCCGTSSVVDTVSNQCKFSRKVLVRMEGVSNTRWISWSHYFGLQDVFLSYMINYFMFILIGVFFATLGSWLCSVYCSSATGSGIPEVKTILSGFRIPNFLGFRVGVIKCIGLCLAVSSGLSSGKEGPLVHIACCWAELLAVLSPSYRNEKTKYRELLSAACAVGVSIAFGAPLGGVLFSLEEVSSHFPSNTLWKAFYGAVIGALSLKWFDVGGTGRLALFGMDSISLAGTWQIQELIPFSLIGLLGGIIGSLFIKVHLYWLQKKQCMPIIIKYPITEVFVITTITCIINYPFPMLRATLTSLLEQLFSRCEPSTNVDLFHFCTSPSSLQSQKSHYRLDVLLLIQFCFVAAVRFFETCVTFGIYLPVGLFIPTLTVGAVFGRVIGLLVIKTNNRLRFLTCHECIHPGVYAIVGAVAVMGGATRVTISLVVIAFELTGGLSYIVPFMIAVLIAKWVGDALCPLSIYDCYIYMKGYSYLTPHQQVCSDDKVSTTMLKRYPALIQRNNTIPFVENMLTNSSFECFPILTTFEEKRFLGYISRDVLIQVIRNLKKQPSYYTEDVISFIETDEIISLPCTIKEKEAKDIELGTYPRISDTSYNPVPYALDTTKDAPKSHNIYHLMVFQPFRLCAVASMTDAHTIFRYFDVETIWITKNDSLIGVLTKNQMLTYIRKFCNIPLL
ncbi:H(+)/Cl(-) exchange transporter 5-like [Hylaeus volcanicus]|uniref:H(+)/Cl(-) exchange transporter 5-like n=1 Tax=Hylaeus volcanicus TaxID=313075 RepID=UPI0023B812DD|nr:H(+)/Cl(-) exchange transporter 5-like [Hylaeus volcanicus]